MELKPNEINYIKSSPSGLRAAAEYNDLKATEADGMGMNESTDYHEKRAAELRTEADRIEKEWEQ